MKYRDRLIVTAGEATGHQDPTTYEWVVDDDPSQIILDCPANVQAGGLITANRRSVSEVYADADGVAFVPPLFLGDLMRVEVGSTHKVTIVYAPIRRGSAVDYLTATAEPKLVRPEDRALLLRYT